MTLFIQIGWPYRCKPLAVMFKQTVQRHLPLLLWRELVAILPAALAVPHCPSAEGFGVFCAAF